MLWLIFFCSLLFVATSYATSPAWWTTRAAVNNSQTTNDAAVATIGQLKLFTARAVQELNDNLEGGAGADLNNLVADWMQDYHTNGYSGTIPKPTDFQAATIGQLKYVGDKIWSRLVDEGYTNAAPGWLSTTNSNSNVALIGQLKTVFDFDLTSNMVRITSPLTVTAATNIPFSYTITATGNPTPSSFSASSLPGWLSTSGPTLSGTPTSTGIYTANIDVSNGITKTSGVLVINVVTGSTDTVTIISPASATATVGTNFTYQIVATGSPLLFGATGLPSGLSCDPFSGIISGTPITAGTSSVSLSASNSSGTPGTATLLLTVLPIPSGGASGTPPIIGGAANFAEVGVPYSFTYQVSGSPVPTFGLTTGSLPPGLTLSTGGMISGTPTLAGTYSGSVSASNGFSSASVQPFSIVVLPGVASSMVAMFNFEPDGAPTPGGNWNTVTNYTSGSISNARDFNSGGLTGIYLNVTSGFTYAANYGVISTALYPSPIQTYSFAIANGGGTAAVTLSGLDPSTTYNLAVFGSADGGYGSANYSIGTTTLAYLLGNNTTNTITFRNVAPDSTGKIVLSVTANSSNIGDLGVLQLSANTISMAPTITNGPPPAGRMGTPYNFTYQTIGFPTPTFSVSSGSMPAGLTLSETGTISGTPTTTGTYTGTVTINNGNGMATQSFSIPIYTLISFTSKFNFEPMSVATPGGNWNTVSDYISGRITNAKDISTGAFTGISLDVTSVFTFADAYGVVSTALYPAPVQSYSFAIASGAYTGEVTLSGLSTSSTYNLTIFGSDTGGNGSTYHSTYTIGTTSVNYINTGNTTRTASFTSVASDSAGKIVLKVTAATDHIGSLGALTLSTTSTTDGQPPKITNGPATTTGTAGTAYSFSYTAAGYPSPIFSVNSGNLPPGLSLSSSGVLSGTPSAGGVYPGSVAAGNTAGSTSQNFTITITQAPSITNGPPTNTTQTGDFYSFTYQTVGLPSPTFNLTSGSLLPPGLTLTTAGVITGVPTTVGTYSGTTRAQNGIGSSANQNFTIAVQTAPTPAFSANFNFEPTGASTPGGNWNTVTNYISGSITNAKDFNTGSSTGVALHVTSTFTAAGAYGAASTTLFPSPIQTYSFKVDNTSSAGVVTLSDLNSNSIYNLTIFGSDTSGFGSAAYTIGNTTLSLALNGNTSNTVTFSHVAPDRSGDIVLTVGAGTGHIGSIGALIISPATSSGQAPSILNGALPPLANIGEAFSYSGYSVASTGATSFYAVGLPDGLSIDASTGVISGTPTQAGVFSVLITGTNSIGSTNGIFTLTVLPTATTITSATTALIGINQPFSYTLTSSHDGAVLSARNLPSWLTFNNASGILRGTAPASAGTYTADLSADSASATLTITVTDHPVITTPSNVYAAVGLPLSFTIKTALQADSISYSGTAALPSGLSLSLGVLSGTPVAVGTTTGTLTASISGGNSSTQTFTINIGNAPVMTSTASATGTAGSAFSYTFTASNSPMSYGVDPDTLPAGLVFNPATGMVSGTPTANVPMTYSVQFHATNLYGTSNGTLALTIHTLTPVITQPLATLEGNVGIPVANYIIPIVGGQSTGLTGGTFTGDLSGKGIAVSTDGVITGTPNTIGTFSGTVSVANTTGTSAAVPMNMVILSVPPLVIPTQTIAAVQGKAISQSIQTVQNLEPNAHVSPSFSTSFNLSSYGLAMSGSGVISGTPTASTTGTAMTVTATEPNVTGTSTGTVKLIIYPTSSPGISSSLSQTVTIGEPFSYTLATINGATPAITTTATGLVDGLTFINGTTSGVITGTIATTVTSGLHNISLSTASASGTSSGTLALTVDSYVQFQQGSVPTGGYSTPSVNVAYDPVHASVATSTYNTGTTLGVGLISSPAGGGAKASSRALLAFDLSAIPAYSVITGACLVIKPSSPASSGTATMPIKIYATVPFAAATAYWNQNSGYYPTELSSLDFNPSSLSSSVLFPSSESFAQEAQAAFDSDDQTLYLAMASPTAEAGSNLDYVGFINGSGTGTNNPMLVVSYETGSAPPFTAIPVVTSAGLYHGTVNTGVSYTITASNSPTSFSTTSLPAGLTCNTSTGAITGTVTSASHTIATVHASNSNGTGDKDVAFDIENSTDATGLAITGGNNQVGSPGTFLTTQLKVHASTNSGATPLANKLVTFETSPGGGTLSTTNSGTPTDTALTLPTDVNGDAKVYLYLSQSLLLTTVKATVNVDAMSPIHVMFTETSSLLSSVPSSSNNLAIYSVVSGDWQMGPTNQVLTSPVTIRAVNAIGQPISSMTNTFTVVGGVGSVSGASNGTLVTTSTNLVTDTNGEASVYWRPAGSDGTVNKVEVSSVSSDATPIYLTAVAQTTGTTTAPTPGGGSAPVVDGDPGKQVPIPPMHAKLISVDEFADDPVNHPNENIIIIPHLSDGIQDQLLYAIDTDTSDPDAFGIKLLTPNEINVIEESDDDPGHIGVRFTPTIDVNYTDDNHSSGTIDSPMKRWRTDTLDADPANDDNVNGEADLYISDPGRNFIVTTSTGAPVHDSYHWEWTIDNYGNLKTINVKPKPSAPPGAYMDVSCIAYIDFFGSYAAGTAHFEIPTHPMSYDVSFDEASGSRYRKIALNGLPMPDEKPQQSGETDQEKEETYIDALTDGLRHSTTDVYMPVAGSDMAISARRDFRPQVWNDRNGLRPHEQPDLPFGPCWSSNLAPNIRVVYTDDPASTSPAQTIVTDETGAVHTFILWYDPTTKAEKYFPMPTAKNEQQTPNLESLTSDGKAPATYTFKRKYGTTLIYQDTGLLEAVSEDRLEGSFYKTYNRYARLVQAQDRLGNTVRYQYGSLNTLIPSTITVDNQPDSKLYIQQMPVSEILGGTSTNPQSVITAIWDANGNKTSYGYSSAFGTKSCVLTSVTAPDGAVTHYGYSSAGEQDTTPQSPQDPRKATYSFLDIGLITDPRGNTYTFDYTFDHSKRSYMNNPSIPFNGYYIQPGAPRNVTAVHLPGNQGAATFTNGSSILISNGGLQGQRLLTVKDATNFTRSYQFSNAVMVTIPHIPGRGGGGTSSANVIAYEQLDISYGEGSTFVGKETFDFDLNANMALSSATDLSGNTTTYAHGDVWVADPSYQAFQRITGVTLSGDYDDPTTQTNALSQQKKFQYDTKTRVMTDVIDENNNKTHYTIDSLGRRTSEQKQDSSNHIYQETDFTYGNSKYPGFVIQKEILNGQYNDTSTGTSSLKTKYVPDADGRVAQEIVDPDGLNLVTSYTYDANGNKLSSTDPLGHTTWFSYDKRNRLITVTFADGGQKQMVYDERGNKIKEYDENGIATLYHYDALNRLDEQARDMNGNGTIDSNDLITSYTYNAVNSKLTMTDPRGHVTTMTYDSLQRVSQIRDALNNITQFSYGINSGGSAFDSSSFKPTHTIDPRGIVTDITYDALYRPLRKSVLYDTTTAPSVTSMQYDDVGNLTKEIDPLGNTISHTYDPLNRLTQTTYPDSTMTSLSFIQFFYTSTNLKWKTLVKNGDSSGTHTHEQVTTTAFDGAGRPVTVTQPYVSGYPITTTYYDAAGNVVATKNPLNNVWSYVYDARNRKVQEFDPAVTDGDPADTLTYNTSVRPTHTWVYDQGGRLTSSIDPRGAKTDTFYDVANRVIEVDQPSVPVATGTSPARPKTYTSYDKNGNVQTVQDPNGHTTTNTYDELNRLTQTVDPVGITVKYGYDAVGNRTQVTDGNGNITRLTYDGLNRNTSVTDPAGHSVQFKYNGLNKTQRIDSLGQVTSYFYDVRNRLSSVYYYSADTATNSQRNYVYDKVGNLLNVYEPGKSGVADVTYSYDLLNRVTKETSGYENDYTYDLAGNRTQVVYGGTGRTLVNTYDNLNRLYQLSDGSGARVTTYAYDLNGNITGKTLPNGNIISESFDALNRAYTLGAVVTAGSASFYNYHYGYDLVGNVASITETYTSGLSNRTTTNTYDANNRLTVEAVTGAAPNSTTTYTYDNANNRTSKTVTGTGAVTAGYGYNSLNQLTSYTVGTTTTLCAYNANGNRTGRTIGANTDAYSYDFENRLVKLVKTTPGSTGTYQYTYDYRTRRVARDESGISGGSLNYVSFSGGTSVYEYDNSLNPVVEYIRGSDYGGGIGGVLYTYRSSAYSYTHEDRRGDVIAKTATTTGTATYQAQYEAFGKRPAEHGSTSDRQKANTKDEDPWGALDEGMRYRDLDTGTFLTRDPAGFVDGPNLYTYVVQNPWTHFDPEGLASEQDYKNDQAKAKAWHDQASKEAGGDKAAQKKADDTYKSWTDADQKKINSIEATAKKWNDVAKKDVMKELGKSWDTIDDTSYSYSGLASTDPKAFLASAQTSANNLSQVLTDPVLMASLVSSAKANGLSPQAIASIITMETRGWTRPNGGTGFMDYGKQPLSEAWKTRLGTKPSGMNDVSVGPAQLKGPARKAAGLTVDQAGTYQGAFIGAGTWLSDKNPGQVPGSNEAQRAAVYNGSTVYGVEFEVVRSQVWK